MKELPNITLSRNKEILLTTQYGKIQKYKITHIKEIEPDVPMIVLDKIEDLP